MQEYNNTSKDDDEIFIIAREGIKEIIQEAYFVIVPSVVRVKGCGDCTSPNRHLNAYAASVPEVPYAMDLQ